jgi:DNA-binding XRE family transcriptional regulator
MNWEFESDDEKRELFWGKKPKTNYKRVGYLLKLYREKANLTQDQLADKIKVSRQTVYSWENGVMPRIQSVFELLEIFNIQLQDLFKPNMIPNDEGLNALNFEINKLKVKKHNIELHIARLEEKVKKILSKRDE